MQTELFEDSFKQLKTKLIETLINDFEYPIKLAETSFNFYKHEVSQLLKNKITLNSKDPITEVVNEALTLIKKDEDVYFNEFYASSIESI